MRRYSFVLGLNQSVFQSSEKFLIAKKPQMSTVAWVGAINGLLGVPGEIGDERQK